MCVNVVNIIHNVLIQLYDQNIALMTMIALCLKLNKLNKGSHMSKINKLIKYSIIATK